MSYNSINQCANDEALRQRVTAACAAEGVIVNPGGSMESVIWGVATASDVEAAYAYAIASETPNPGGDETVITDAMILSHVQALLASP